MRWYMYSRMVMCVVDFIKSYRVNKHRNRESYNEYIYAII